MRQRGGLRCRGMKCQNGGRARNEAAGSKPGRVLLRRCKGPLPACRPVTVIVRPLSFSPAFASLRQQTAAATRRKPAKHPIWGCSWPWRQLYTLYEGIPNQSMTLPLEAEAPGAGGGLSSRPPSLHDATPASLTDQVGSRACIARNRGGQMRHRRPPSPRAPPVVVVQRLLGQASQAAAGRRRPPAAVLTPPPPPPERSAASRARASGT